MWSCGRIANRQTPDAGGGSGGGAWAGGLPRDGDDPLTRADDSLVWQGYSPAWVMDLTLPAYAQTGLARFLKWTRSTHGAVIASSTKGIQPPFRTGVPTQAPARLALKTGYHQGC